MTTSIHILGGHQTDFARVWSREGLDLSDMIRESAQAAMEDARVAPLDIATIHVGNAFGELQRRQGHLGAMVAQVVPELSGRPAMRHEGACASGSLAILSAMAEIEAGRYDCALVIGVEEQKNLPGDEASRLQNAAAWQGREDLDCRFMWPAVFGRLAQEYEARWGLDRRHLNAIAELNYANARRNPRAQTRRWTFGPEAFGEDEATNPMIEPGTRRQDCAQITDGACAVVLASARYLGERGLDAARLPRILGWGHRNTGLQLVEKLERSRGDGHVFPELRGTIEDAFRRAQLPGVEALDGIETHDCFTSTEYMALDHWGLAPPGQGWRVIEDGTIAKGGRCPVNASGGLIGGGHPVGATGVRMLLDAARQVTGRAGDCQIEGARRIGTLNIGGACATTVSFIVGA